MGLTYAWAGNDPPPPGYSDLLKSPAAQRRVTVEDLEAFVQKHPIVLDGNRQSLDYAKKILNADPHTFKADGAHTLLWNWIRQVCGGDPAVQSIEFGDDGGIIFYYSYDYYALKRLTMEWRLWRVEHVKKRDYTWFCHGMRLLGRLQWWTLTGTDNWTNPQGKKRAPPTTKDKKPASSKRAKSAAAPACAWLARSHQGDASDYA